MLRGVRLSLANKCQLLFGLAVVLILGAALTVAGWRMQTLVEQGPQRRAQDLAELYLAGQIDFAAPGQMAAEVDLPADDEAPSSPVRVDSAGVILNAVDATDFERVTPTNPFLAEAVERFTNAPDLVERFEPAYDREGRLFFRYAHAIRAKPTPDAAAEGEAGSTPGELVGVLLIQLRDADVAIQQTLNRIYTIAAWLVAGVLAIGVFWFILTRLILSPVRVLRGYAERVSEGDLSIRSDINTGDEFEQLSDVFNTMLENLKSKQDQLSGVNKTLDLKLVEMAESNVALYEANKVKGEFLANVSHELRTPLNSIIGFAEVLQETLADRTGPVDEKRKRYATNIITSSRRLLDLINELLDLAKIEAGRMELRLSTVSLRDTGEGLVSLMTPQAQKKDIALRLKMPADLPMVETDAGKLQQVLFNFLANAIKFTPPGGTVTLSASKQPAESGNGAADRRAFVRVAVSDTGPGIAPEDHQRIFEKFVQLDATETKTHTGTGLGLTISAELVDLLRGRVELDSTLGSGATFAVVLPVVFYKPDEVIPRPRSAEEPGSDAGDAPATAPPSAASTPP